MIECSIPGKNVALPDRKRERWAGAINQKVRPFQGRVGIPSIHNPRVWVRLSSASSPTIAHPPTHGYSKVRPLVRGHLSNEVPNPTNDRVAVELLNSPWWNRGKTNEYRFGFGNPERVELAGNGIKNSRKQKSVDTIYAQTKILHPDGGMLHSYSQD